MLNQNIAASISEIENAFFNHASDAGVIFTNRPLTADGALHRAYVEGDKRGTKNGAYVLHPNGKPSGWFQHFVSGVMGKWTLSGKREPMSFDIKELIEADKQRRKIEQVQRHKVAAQKAIYILNKSTLAISHPYLNKKRVKPHDLRCYRSSLVIPLYDENGAIAGLQFIGGDGIKSFLTGSKVQGSCFLVGNLETGGTILICEGWATGASLYEFTGYFTVVAFSAGNLLSVAQLMRKHHQHNEIIICGDNDKSGTGQKAARAAALAVNGKYILPATVGHDFNDEINMMVAP